MRLWLEEGIPPERSRDLAVAHAGAVAGLAGVWAYQGLVPKLWKADGDEVEHPVSLYLAMAALAVVALATTDGRPSGRRPLRSAPGSSGETEER